MAAVKWCGIDFGQSIMEPSGLRTYRVIGDIYKLLGRPEKIPEAIKRFRVLVEAQGDVNIVKEAHRDDIHAYVLGGSDEAMELFNLKEQEHFILASGAKDALKYMRQKQISVNIVAELKKTLGPVEKDIISRFLKNHDLTEYFDGMVTPQGRVDFRENTTAESYKGKTKESGELYRRLLEDLGGRGIRPQEILMVGDKITTDIDPPATSASGPFSIPATLIWGHPRQTIAYPVSTI